MPSIFMLLLSCAFIFHVSLAHSWSTLLLNAELVSNYIHEEHSYIMCQLILADTTVDVWFGHTYNLCKVQCSSYSIFLPWELVEEAFQPDWDLEQSCWYTELLIVNGYNVTPRLEQQHILEWMSFRSRLWSTKGKRNVYWGYVLNPWSPN